MPFTFGGNTSNTSFNQNGTQHQVTNQTSTPTNAPWVTDLGQTLGGHLQDMSAWNPSSFVAGSNALQTDAAQRAVGLGADTGGFHDAFNLTGAGAQTAGVNQLGHTDAAQASGANGSQFMGQYFNPYLDKVANSSLNDFDTNAGQTRAQQSLDLAHSGAFGGSGAAITQSMTEGQLARARDALDSGLRAQGFDTAAGFGQSDANRAAQVSMSNASLAQKNKEDNASILLSGLKQQGDMGAQLGNLSSAWDTNNRANLATQYGIGTDQRTIAQQQLTAPLDYQSYLTSQYAGLPLSLFHGETDNGTNDTTSTLSGKKNSTGLNFGYKNGGG